jgi:hypothetical protein
LEGGFFGGLARGFGGGGEWYHGPDCLPGAE